MLISNFAERVVKENEQMLAVLQRWGYQRGEVRYVLRHHKAGYETGWKHQEWFNDLTFEVSTDNEWWSLVVVLVVR